ncbi:hypothetical protein ACSRUE_15375 [Sorangium sp. KYC3313]
MASAEAPAFLAASPGEAALRGHGVPHDGGGLRHLVWPRLEPVIIAR